MFVPSINSVALWPTVVVLAVATITDLKSRRIPNWLVVPFLAMGIVVSMTLHGLSGLEESLLGVLAAASVLGIFCFLGGMGMGDLKLCAAVGAWVGPSQMFVALVMTGLAGGVMALCWAVAGGFVKQTLARTRDLLFGFTTGQWREHTLESKSPLARKMPYAPAIAVGTILSFLGK
jgi:prepilin peptidase CpaA